MKTLLSLCLLCTTHAFSQSPNYNDVAVIVNDNSQESIEIANYFQTARNIPSQNMIHVFATSTENIDSLEFEQIRAQIESYLLTAGIIDSINYLVTTKGVPLSVDGDCALNNLPGAQCASVDSELALILGPLSASIGVSGAIINPIYLDTQNFSRDATGIFLVTRLDGYSTNDVFDLIDRSGPNTGINKLSAQAIVDISNATGGDLTYFESEFQPAYDYLSDNFWSSQFDLDILPLVNQTNVFGYFGLGHGPLSGASFNYDWTAGAVGGMTMCNSAFTFDAATNANYDFLVADLIADGCTGAMGHVDFIYFSQLWNAAVFLERYLDSLQTYNLAESYYMSEKTLSWKTVIIGDPKASVYVDQIASAPELNTAQIRLFPNPTAESFQITGIHELPGNLSLTITGIDGALVEMADQVKDNDQYHLPASGIYFINVFADGNHIGTHKVVRR